MNPRYVIPDKKFNKYDSIWDDLVGVQPMSGPTAEAYKVLMLGEWNTSDDDRLMHKDDD